MNKFFRCKDIMLWSISCIGRPTGNLQIYIEQIILEYYKVQTAEFHASIIFANIIFQVQLSQLYRATLQINLNAFANFTVVFKLRSFAFHNSDIFAIMCLACSILILMFVKLLSSGVIYHPRNLIKLNLFAF